jgi:uncharacterized membrane protein YgcG
MWRNTTVAIVAVLLFSFSVFSLPVFADKCKDPIVDEVNAFSAEDITRVNSAINKLVLLGADPRVQVLSSYHNTKSVDEYKAMFQAKCPSWQAPDGGLKNNIVLFLIVPKKQATGFYYGEQWRRFLSSGKVANSTDMNARFRDGKFADGIVVGLENVADLVSVKPSQAGKPIVINHPADYSGLWSFFKWALWFGVICVLGYVFWLIFRRREDVRGTQRDAATARAKCVQAMNSYTTPLAVLKAKILGAVITGAWKAYLNDLFEQTQQAFSRAAAEFNALNRSANNPDTPRLSSSEYGKMQSRYEKLSAMFETAQTSLEKAQAELARALRGEPVEKSFYEKAPRTESKKQDIPVKPVQTKSSPQSAPIYGNHRYPQERVHDDTTIVILNTTQEHHHDDVWGNQRTADPDVPVIVDPADIPSGGDGISTNWGKTGDGDGTSTAWGKSGDGDGVSSSWNNDSGTKDSEPSSSTWEGGQGTTY